jgi:hypothetical protein
MRKYWLLAGALLALGAAIVALPAWADSKDEPAGPLASSQRAHASVPMGFKFPVSAEEARRQRERLAELTTCLRERGADIPGFNVDAGGVAIMLPPAAADRAMREVAEECGLPAPPTHADFAEQRDEMEARRARLDDKLAQCLPRARLRPDQRP